MKAIYYSDILVHIEAVKSLGELGRTDDKIIDTLLDALKKGKHAAVALSKLGRSDDKVVDALLEAIIRPGKLGRADDKIISTLKEKLGVANKYAHIAASNALYRISRRTGKLICPPDKQASSPGPNLLHKENV